MTLVADVSFRGTVELSRAAWPRLIASGAGRLIVIASASLLGAATGSAYGAAKGGAWAFANALAEEGKSVGVQVTTILPSAWTPMTEAAFSSNSTIASTLRDAMGPQHVAEFVAFLAHQDTTVSGATFQVSAGNASQVLSAALPRITAPESTAEEWTQVADQLLDESGELTILHDSNEQFTAEMIAAHPDVAGLLAGMNTMKTDV